MSEKYFPNFFIRCQEIDVDTEEAHLNTKYYLNFFSDDSSDDWSQFKKYSGYLNTDIPSQQPSLTSNVGFNDHYMDIEQSVHQNVIETINPIVSRQSPKTKSAKKNDYDKNICTFATKNCCKQFKRLISLIYDEKKDKMIKAPQGDLSKWIARKLMESGQKGKKLITLLNQIYKISHISHMRLLQLFNPSRDDEFYLEKLIFKEFFEYFLDAGIYAKLLRDRINVDNPQRYNEYCQHYLIYLVGMPYQGK